MIVASGRGLAHILFGAASVLAVGLGLVALRLSQGPIALDFLAPYMRAGVDEALGEGRLEFETVELAWNGAARRFDVTVGAAKVRDEAGADLLAVDEVALSFAGEALLSGRVIPKTVTLIEPEIALVREADGAIRIDGASAGAGEGSLDIDAILRGELPVRGAVRDAALRLEDRMMGREWRLDHVDAVATRDEDGTLRAELSGRLAVGEARIPVALTASRAGEGGAIEGVLHATGVNPAELAELDPALADLARLDAPIAARIEAALAGDGALTSARATLDAGAGVAHLPDIGAARLESAHIAARYDQAEGVLDIDALEITSDLYRGGLSGRLLRDPDAEGIAGGFEVTLSAGALNAPDLFPGPVALQGARLRGRAELSPEGRLALTTPEVEIRVEGTRVTGAIEAALAEGGALSAKGEARFADVPYKTVRLLWPLTVGPNARAWVVSHVAAAHAPTGRLQFDFAPGREELRLDFDIVEGRFTYFGELAPIRDASGSATLRLDRFDIAFKSGRARPEGAAADIEVTSGSFAAIGIDGDDERAEIAVGGRGRIADILTLIDAEPLGYPTKLELEPGAIDGAAEVSLNLKTPLKRDVTLDVIAVDVMAEVSEVDAPNIVGDYDLTDGVATLKVSTKALTVAGDARLNGAPVALTWDESFTGGPEPTRYTVSGELGAAEREMLGLPLMPWLEGPARAHFELYGGRGRIDRAEGRLDFAQAELRLDALDWRKPAGVPTEVASAIAFHDGGAISIGPIQVSGPDLKMAGAIEFGPEGGFTSARFSELKVADRIDLGVAIEALPEGFALTAKGARFDARAIIDEAFSEARAEPAAKRPPFTLDLALERLRVSDEASLRGVALSLDHDGEAARALELSGRLADGPALSLELKPAGGGARSLRFTSQDAGGLARGFGLFDNGDGGKLDLTALLPASESAGATQGRLRIEAFKIHEAPALARALTVGSLTGIADLLSGDGITFDELELPFAMEGGVIRILEGRAAGPALGLTMAGEIDERGRSLDLSGTIVPAYTLNSLLGGVPLLGDVLVGREGEGIIGITYSLSGPLDDPSIGVNPLSALAPGILRRIFEFGNPVTAAQGAGGVAAPVQRPDLGHGERGGGWDTETTLAPATSEPAPEAEAAPEPDIDDVLRRLQPAIGR